MDVGVAASAKGFNRPILTIFVIYVFYLLIGSAIFVSLETAPDEKRKNKSMQTIVLTQTLIQTLKRNDFTDENIFLSLNHEAQNTTYVKPPEKLGGLQLYGEKVFFAFVLITTIGFGNVSPKSALGQAICIIYSFLGFPLQCNMIRLLGFKFRGCLRKIFKMAQNISLSQALLVMVGFMFFVFWILVFMLIPAYIFTISDEWTYSRGVYFSYVSLTTIGLGDFIAGVSEEHYDKWYYSLNIMLMLIWMFFGLGFGAVTMTILSYFMGVAVLESLDSKCLERYAAKRKYKRLLNLVEEINWQLVKYKPPKFDRWSEIEEFKDILTDDPQNVTKAMLQEKFNVALDLREKAYAQLSTISRFRAPIMTPVITETCDTLPAIISKRSVVVTFTPTSPDVMGAKQQVETDLNYISSVADDITQTRSVNEAILVQRKDYIIPSLSRINLHHGSVEPEKLLEDIRTMSKLKGSVVSVHTPNTSLHSSVEEDTPEEEESEGRNADEENRDKSAERKQDKR